MVCFRTCNIINVYQELKTNNANNPIAILGRSSDDHIDKHIVKDLVSDEDALLAKQEAKAQKKKNKAESKTLQRLKQERRKGANADKDTGDDDDDTDLLATIAKKGGSRKRR